MTSAVCKTAPALDDVEYIAGQIARDAGARLVKEISENKRVVVQRLLKKAIDNAWTDEQLQQRISASVGLDLRGYNAVENFRNSKQMQELPKGIANKRAKEYADRLRKARALTIARTELSKARHTAQRLVWKQQQDDGLIGDAHRKVAVNPTCCEKLCKGHQDDTYDLAEQTIGPPFHPNCTCTEELVAAIIKKEPRDGDGDGFVLDGKPGMRPATPKWHPGKFDPKVEHVNTREFADFIVNHGVGYSVQEQERARSIRDSLDPNNLRNEKFYAGQNERLMRIVNARDRRDPHAAAREAEAYQAFLDDMKFAQTPPPKKDETPVPTVDQLMEMLGFGSQSYETQVPGNQNFLVVGKKDPTAIETWELRVDRARKVDELIGGNKNDPRVIAMKRTVKEMDFPQLVWLTGGDVLKSVEWYTKVRKDDPRDQTLMSVPQDQLEAAGKIRAQAEKAYKAQVDAGGPRWGTMESKFVLNFLPSDLPEEGDWPTAMKWADYMDRNMENESRSTQERAAWKNIVQTAMDKTLKEQKPGEFLMPWSPDSMLKYMRNPDSKEGLLIGEHIANMKQEDVLFLSHGDEDYAQRLWNEATGEDWYSWLAQGDNWLKVQEIEDKLSSNVPSTWRDPTYKAMTVKEHEVKLPELPTDKKKRWVWEGKKSGFAGKQAIAQDVKAEFAKVFDATVIGPEKPDSFTLDIKSSFGQKQVGVEFVATWQGFANSTVHVQRTLDFESNAVDHDYFAISKELQNKGIATRVNNMLFDLYAEHGFEYVYVHANIDVGGYTWAAQGFDLRSRSPENYLYYLNRVWNKFNSPEDFGYAELQMWLSRLRHMDSSGSWNSADLPTMFEISQLGRKPGDTTWPGKRALMGTDWSGVLPLPHHINKDWAMDHDEYVQKLNALHFEIYSKATVDTSNAEWRDNNPSQFPEGADDLCADEASDTEWIFRSQELTAQYRASSTISEDINKGAPVLTEDFKFASEFGKRATVEKKKKTQKELEEMMDKRKKGYKC